MFRKKLTLDSNVTRLLHASDQLFGKALFSRWGLCTIAFLLATAIRYFLDPFVGDRIPLVFYAIPVIASSWYFGFLRGLLAIPISLLIVDYLFIDPRFSFGIARQIDMTLAMLFVLNGIFLSFVGSIARQYMIKSQKLADAEKRARFNGQRALEYRDHFLSFASHELKTPLTSVLIYLQIFEKKLIKDHQNGYKTDLVKIKNQIEKMRQLTDRLLEVSNMNDGMMQLKYSKFDLIDCIHEAIELSQLVSTYHHIEILGKKKLRIFADREKILQCLINLITNAKKYSPNENLIKIYITSQRDSVKISVEDFGIGIPKTEQKKIFKRFYRPKESYTFPGIGIGLYFVQMIINRHNGNIRVESEYNKGSTFSITLPR